MLSKFMGSLNAILAVIVIAVAGYAIYQGHQLTEAKTLIVTRNIQVAGLQKDVEARDIRIKTAATALATSEAALTAARSAKLASARETALLGKRLDEALARNKAWADQPVPKEIIDILRENGTKNEATPLVTGGLRSPELNGMQQPSPEAQGSAGVQHASDPASAGTAG